MSARVIRWWFLGVFLAFGMAVSGQTQTLIPLLQFDHAWRYEASGTDLGVAWQTNDFDDAAWPIGPGLFAVGETTSYPEPFRTTLPALGGKITHYFRAWFDMPPEAFGPGMELFATNLVDDGCVIFLNGTEAGRIRVPAGQNYLTLASSGPATEGQFDVVTFFTNNLQAGRNLLAVEVHQFSPTSSDLVWGMRLMAFVPDPVVVFIHPVGGNFVAGDTVILSVEAEGWPLFFQWQKNGVDIAGATNSIHTFLATEAQAGTYTVVVSNAANRIISEPATVSVFPNLAGPVMLSASVVETSTTNIIDVVFSSVPQVTTTQAANFRLTRLSDGQSVIISNATASVRTVRLRVGGPAWQLHDEYVLVANNVKDNRGNTIAPDSRIAVGWPVQASILPRNYEWSFHRAAASDPVIYFHAWMERDYFPSQWWVKGVGHFYFSVCPDPLATDIGFQTEPTLFRTFFDWPASRPASATFRLALTVDDGAIVYLNGVEIYRTNAPPGRPNAGTRALAPRTVNCGATVPILTVNVTNLVAGSNLLAVALLQESSIFAPDIMFALVLDSVFYLKPTLPYEPLPTLNIAPVAPNGVRLSWQGSGYAVESAANPSNSFSYPNGPWLELPNGANPMTNSATEPSRWFRLKKR